MPQTGKKEKKIIIFPKFSTVSELRVAILYLQVPQWSLIGAAAEAVYGSGLWHLPSRLHPQLIELVPITLARPPLLDSPLLPSLWKQSRLMVVIYPEPRQTLAVFRAAWKEQLQQLPLRSRTSFGLRSHFVANGTWTSAGRDQNKPA